MNALVPTNQVAKLLPRLGSNFDGEKLAALAAIDRALRAAWSDWHDLAEMLTSPARRVPNQSCETVPHWRVMAKFCDLRGIGRLNEREIDFILDMNERLSRPTERQIQWLFAIYKKLGGGR